ncbi:MAG: response regulator, partial [Elusimicrobiota bacterium]
MPIVHTVKWFQGYEGVRCLEKGGDSKRLLELIAKSLEEARTAPGPAAQRPAEAAPGAGSPKAPAPLWAWPSLTQRTKAKGRTIALVDADVDRMFTTKDLLEEQGYTVWRAMDMMQFFTFLTDDNIPDLIITDMQMPGGGHHLVQKARSDPRLRRVPIIVMTEMPIAHAVKWFQGYEGIRCLEKGGGAKQLLWLVAKCLKEAQASPSPPGPAAQGPAETPFVAEPPKTPDPLWAWHGEGHRAMAEGRTIALVDDDAELMAMTKDLLELQGYSVWRAADMIQFFTLLADDNIPDLIITDMQMPGGGHHLVQRARSDPRLRRVPIIVMTGMPIVHTVKWFQGYEGVRCLEKGGDSKRLLELIAKSLEEARDPPR